MVLSEGWLIQFVKRYLIRIILMMFGKEGQVWLETKSLIRKLKRGHYWEKEIALLQHLVSPGDVCLDVGANCGQWSYWMSKRVGPSGRVIAIEPIPMTTQVLARVVDKLRLYNVEIQHVAVGDRNCRIRMLVTENEYKFKSLPTARVLDYGETFDSDIEVNMITMNSLADLLNINRVSFIKCDIEGFEMHFFQGGRSILTRDKPAIICEIEQKHTIQFGYTPDDLFGLLESLGYRSYTYSSKALFPTKGISYYVTNYVFLHKSNKRRLEFLIRERRL